MNIGQVREALADALAGSVDDVQWSAYVLSNPTPPCGFVVPGPADHNAAFQRGHAQRDFNVQIFVGLASDIGAQKKLDLMLDDDTIAAALEADTTLGGVVEAVNVDRDGGYQQFLREGQPPLLGVEWTVRVYG